MPDRNTEAWLLHLALPEAVAAPDLPPLTATEFAHLGQLARQHGVLPAVAMNAARLTKHNLVALQQALIGPTGFAMTLRLRLQPILQALRENGVNAVVLRGPEFADRLYPQPGLRLFTDLDILVPRVSVETASTTLRQLGYQLQNLKNLKHTAPYGEQVWKHPDHGQEQVEIHWNLVNSPAVQHGVSVELVDLQFDRATGQLTPASLLLIAVVHGATSHSFDRLQILCDIRQIARQAVDEEYLAAICKQTGSTLSMLTGLSLAERAFSDPSCRRLRQRLARTGLLARWVLTPSAVLRSESPLNKLRRQLFRELLKRR